VGTIALAAVVKTADKGKASKGLKSLAAKVKAK
jgi:hypothetical protein